MNILFVTPSPPSQFNRIRSLDLLNFLAKRHSVHLVSLSPQTTTVSKLMIKKNRQSPVNFNQKTLANCRSIKVVKKSLANSLFSCSVSLLNNLLFNKIEPLEVAYCRSTKMKEAINEIISQQAIDLIYVKRLRSFQFVDHLAGKIPMVIDTTDAMSLFYKRASKAARWWERALYWHEAMAYQRYEKKLFSKVKHWIVCSPVDRDYLKKRAPENVKFYVVPNGVDMERFAPVDKGITPSQEYLSTPARRDVILFRGLMHKLVNIDAAVFFAKQIFPLVRQVLPQTQLRIVGIKPAWPVRCLNNNDSVVVTGYVEDIRKEIAQSNIVVCPVRIGAGTKHKILQAWSMAKPVVSTFLGAEGLAVKDGKNILLADSANDFAASVIRVLKDKKLQQRLGKEGRITVEKYYSMEVVGEKLEAVLENVVRSRK